MRILREYSLLFCSESDSFIYSSYCWWWKLEDTCNIATIRRLNSFLKKIKFQVQPVTILKL